MTTEMTNSALAGAETSAPAGDVQSGGMPEVLSIDDAVARMMDDEDVRAPNQPETAAQGAEERVAGTEPTEPETAAAGQEEADQTGDEENTAEAGPYDIDRLSGHAELRLRDGTVYRVSDLKADIDLYRQVGPMRQQLDARARDLQAKTAQIAQREQFFAQILPVALAAAEAAIPPEPELPAWDESDPFDSAKEQHAYNMAVYQRNKKIGELQQLQMAQRQQTAEYHQQREAEHREYMAREYTAAMDAIPRLRDDGERQKFVADGAKLAETIGFSLQEYNQVADHRLFKLIDLGLDGLKYRQLKSQPPKPAPIAAPQAAPVAEPGKRQSASEAAAASRQELLDRAKRRAGGISLDEAAGLAMSIKL